MSTSLKPAPFAHMSAFAIAMAGVLFTRNLSALGMLWAVCAAIMICQGNATALVRFHLYLWLPLACGLALVWGGIVRAAPSQAAGSDSAAGFHYAMLVSSRLATLAVLFQSAFLPLRGLELAAYWSAFGLPTKAVAGLTTVFQSWPDFKRRVDQVVAARCARGLMPDRKFATRCRQLPFAFRTLFLASLESGFHRADRWESERLPERLLAVVSGRARTSSMPASIVWIFFALLWSGYAFRNLFLR